MNSDSSATALRDSPAPRRLRLLTYNIFFCPRLNELRDFLREINPDIVCLQEVLITDRSRRPENQPQWLADQLGYHYECNPNWRRFRGTGGNALLSRFALTSVEVLADPWGYRFALAARLSIHGVPIHVIASHFVWVARPLITGIFVSVFRRTAQIRQAVNWARRSKLPCIIAGDFNMLPFGPEYQTIARCLTDCTRATPVAHLNTRPTWGLPVQLDYVFASHQFRTLGCEVINADYSDHRPVVVDLELQACG